MVPTRLSDGQRPTLDVSQLPDTPDPLTLALQPPPDETPVEKGARIVAELAAKKVSDNIDAAIRVEKAALRKLRQNEVRVLLLGQSESGKSTCIKQFQILYSPNAFAAERANWRAVIYLNLIRTVRRILDVVSPPISPSMFPPEPPEPELDPKTLELVNDSDKRSVTSQNSSSDQLLAPHATKFRELQLRLKPLKLVEDLLVSKLAVGPESEGEATELGDWKVGGGGAKEYFVNASSWMRSMGKMKSMGDIKQRNSDDSGSASGSGSGTSASGARANGSRENLRSDDPFRLIEACRQDMINLWRDPAVQKILHAKKIRLEESAGFFLNDIERITERKYIPSDQDVLNARLKTLGVIEHHFQLSRGMERGADWRIFDVGGARNQRHTWVPFFDDVNAIIFLAPISAFDQVLVEDPRVNRLDDSIHLFKMVCANKLLSKVSIVLFLNKCDLLRAKLEAGVKLKNYVVSYGDRPNDYENVSRYFRSKFGAMHRDFSPNDRELYMHLTSVNDTQSTIAIIANVRDTILRQNLKSSSLI